MATLPIHIAVLFPLPKDAQAALRQCRIMERAETLFTDDIYTWYIANQYPYLFGVCGPKGQHYEINLRDRTCTCPGFQQDKVCKHLVAVLLNPACEEASQVKQMELKAAMETDVRTCRCDRADRLIREAGGGF